MEHWDKDDEDLEIESDPKIHQEDVKYGDGEEVRDLEILHSDEDKSEDSEEEEDEEVDANNDESQDRRNNQDDKDESQDRRSDDGPRRSTRTRAAPINLVPNMKGQSYAMKKINIKVKRDIKKELKIPRKKKLREEHYNLLTQGIRTEKDCLEYTNLEGMIMAIFMTHTNERTEIGNFKSFSQQYQLGKGLKLFGDRGHEASVSDLEQLHHR